MKIALEVREALSIGVGYSQMKSGLMTSLPDLVGPVQPHRSRRGRPPVQTISTSLRNTTCSLSPGQHKHKASSASGRDRFDQVL